MMEVPLPHFFPMMIWGIVALMRCYDRRGRLDSRKSRKIRQEEYDELYVGAEFIVDARMAQILAIIWTTFIYAPALPLLYPIGVANLAMMYFMDKYQVFNFNKLPKNFDETLILKVLRYARLTFPFHLVMGLYLLSNNGILSSKSTENMIPSIKKSNEWSNKLMGFNLITD